MLGRYLLVSYVGFGLVFSGHDTEICFPFKDETVRAYNFEALLVELIHLNLGFSKDFGVYNLPFKIHCPSPGRDRQSWLLAA